MNKRISNQKIMIKSKHLIIFAFIFTILATGCMKTDDYLSEEEEETKSMDDLIIPSGFSFKSTKVINIEINMPAALDFSVLRSRFDIYTKDPAEGGQLINSGSFDENGNFNGKIKIPSKLTEVYVSTIAGSAYVNLFVNGLKSGGVIIDFGDDYGYLPPDTIEPSSLKSYAFLFQHLKATNEGVNIIGNGDFSNNDFGSVYYWTTPVPIDNKWYFTTYRNKMEWVSEGGNGMIKTPTTAPGNNYVGGTLQLIEATPGDVVTLSADIKSVGNNSRLYSWIYLIPINSNGNALAHYNVTYYNPLNEWTRKTLAASMPDGTEKCIVLLWANDYTANTSVNFDNIVVTGPVTDADGDGVSDDDDDYPTDASRAFNIYYPNASTMGSFAFEDNWPGKGDYDFNDLVVDYQYKQVVNSSNELVDLQADFKFKASGATFLNGFGFQMGLEPTDIGSVTGTSILNGYINTLGNGSEAGQAKGTIIVTDNVFNQIPNPGGGIGTNTTLNTTYVDPVTLTINLSTSSPVALSIAGTPPYNPFIIVNADRGREVHLSDQEPTTLANTQYFGTEHDDSNIAAGKYYKTQNNLPWAIETPTPFDYPVEKAAIINAHLKFAAWAESGGDTYTDWYQNLTGYRNSGNIFPIPN
jgi:LruC domain-containing protein